MIAVVGGGLAGITAALALADAGREVVLLESRARLGGLTHSFRRGELDVDNGQHVFLRCCTAYRDLLDRLGVAADTTLQPRLDIPVAAAGTGRRAALRRDRLRPPLHLARALAGYHVLSPVDRARAVRGALALRRLDRAARGVDDVSFGAWLDAHGQSRATRAALWDLVGVATLNARADDASLSLAAMVFQVGLLTDADAADLGWSRVPLQRLHGDAAAVALAAAGVEVRLRARVTALERQSQGWVVATADGALEAAAVVVATDHLTAERLLPPGVVPLPAGWATGLGSVPIVNVHLVFDRRVLDEPFLAGVGTPVQWVFDRTAASGLRRSDPDAQYLALSLSAADDLVGQPAAALRDAMLPEVQRLLPAARGARLLDAFVTREPNATFRPAPGSAALRPAAATRDPDLVLAGAYTATGWPATMEGAVRSGRAAARLLSESRQPTVVPA